jgi:hypothetical protein
MLIESREDNSPVTEERPPPSQVSDNCEEASERSFYNNDRGAAALRVDLSEAASEKSDHEEASHERIEQTDKDRDDFFKKCLESFQKNVMNEITISSSIPFERKHFLIFFADVMPIIREEMYNEFSGYIKDTEFDSYFKLAICSYEK